MTQLKEIEDFKLYSLEQVAELFPSDDARKKKGHVEEVERLVRACGCYRRFGERIFLTVADIHSLFRSISNNNRASDGKPAPSTDGYVIALGSRTDPECQVFIGWAPLMGVDNLIRDVQVYADFKVEFLSHAPRTYGEFLKIKEELKPNRYWGNWYCRGPQSPVTQKVMDELFSHANEDLEDDEV